MLRWDISNTDLLHCPFGDIGMQLRQKRKVLLYAGIGFILIGVLSMVLTYMLLYWSNSIKDDALSDADDFYLVRVHHLKHTRHYHMQLLAAKEWPQVLPTDKTFTIEEWILKSRKRNENHFAMPYKIDRKMFDEIWDIPKLYISTCSNYVQDLRLHAILMWILLYDYKELTQYISEVEM